MSELRQPNFFKAIEARIALALAKAAAAQAGVASLAHHASFTNAGIGPSGTIVFSAPSFTPLSGKVLVMATGIVVPGGGTLVAGDAVDGQLLRDGVAIPGGAMPFSAFAAAAAGGTAQASVFGTWIDTVAAATTHVWAIEAIIGGGHTASFAAAQASITLIELP